VHRPLKNVLCLLGKTIGRLKHFKKIKLFDISHPYRWKRMIFNSSYRQVLLVPSDICKGIAYTGNSEIFLGRYLNHRINDSSFFKMFILDL